MGAFSGQLVPVVGPSGAGKDSLLRIAQERLAKDGSVVFPRRVVTRASQAEAEDHDSMSRVAFADAAARGAFAVFWEAHGNAYGIPIAIEFDLAQGRTVVFNCSRAALIPTWERYPRMTVIEISAEPDILVDRIVARGRETREEAVQRVSRKADGYPAGLPVIRIDNSGPLAEAGHAFCAAIEGLHHARTDQG